jgi:general secretion pathway protein D
MRRDLDHIWIIRILTIVMLQGSILVFAKLPDTAQKVLFSFKNRSLVELLEQMAPQGTNLVFPQRAADLEILKKQNITYLPHEKETSRITAWELLKTLVELSGFSLFKGDNQYTIVRNASVDGGAINREPLPLYTGIAPSELPHDDGRIIYIHYLKNLRVPDPSEKDIHPISLMLKSLLSYNAALMFDPRTNAIILIDKGSHIQSIAHMLSEFDSQGIKEYVEYVPITHLPAQEIVNAFESLKLAAGNDTRTFIKGSPKSDAIGFFTEDTRMVADTERNAVILMGRKGNIDRIIDLIKTLLDIAPGSGESILHYYDLNYLDSMKTAPILNRIVTDSLPTGEQATAEKGNRLFQGVVIAALDQTVQVPALKTEDIAIEQKGYPEVQKLDAIATNVGNRLLIAARDQDWQIIKKLLEQIDVPQRQVLLEVFVVEFAYDQTTNFSGTMRNRTDSSLLPDGVEYLASHITPVINVIGTNPTQLASDLLQIIGPGNLPSLTSRGSLLVSLNDPKTPGIFGLLEILSTVVSAKINSYPYMTINNHKQGILDTTDMIRTTGDLSTTTNGTATIPIINLPATFAINIVPHIISDTRLRLEVGFTDDRYTNKASLTRRTQEVRSTATLNSGEILVMGGLLRVDNLDKASYTPILGHLPIFGSFFRGTRAETITTNITLFVMPTILEPRYRWIEKTAEYLNKNRKFVTRGQISRMSQDPIFRLFLKEECNQQQMLDQFLTLRKDDISSQNSPKILQNQIEEPLPLFDPRALKRMLKYRQKPLSQIPAHRCSKIAQKKR